jgi:hypothetical protein
LRLCIDLRCERIRQPDIDRLHSWRVIHRWQRRNMRAQPASHLVRSRLNRGDALPCRHPLRPFPHRLPPHRRSPHGLVQLALCEAHRGANAAPDRGYRQGALDGGGGSGDPRRALLARAQLGWRTDLAVRAGRAASGSRGDAGGPRRGL